MDQDSGDFQQLSEPEKAKRAFLVSQSRRMRSLNIHLPLTLDESYYLGMNSEQLRERNRDQVLSHDEEDPEKKRVLMVSQLWLWRMDNIVVSACGRKHVVGEIVYGKNGIDEPPRHKELEFDPQTGAMFNFQENNLFKGENMSGLQIAALVFSEVVNHIDGPNYSGLKESIFHVFEKSVANVYDQVKSYMNETTIQKISLEEEMKFVHAITGIRDELAMIKDVITDQEEVWTQFYEDLKDEISKWDDNNRRIAIRPKQQIPKFKRRVQKIDEDAQRVEQWIHGQLDLKKTHASIRESHNSTVLSTTVIGFTIVTVVFTPLSFMTSLLAVPDDNFGWMNQKKYAGKVFMSKSRSAHDAEAYYHSCGGNCVATGDAGVSRDVPLVVEEERNAFEQGRQCISGFQGCGWGKGKKTFNWLEGQEKQGSKHRETKRSRKALALCVSKTNQKSSGRCRAISSSSITK